MEKEFENCGSFKEAIQKESELSTQSLDARLKLIEDMKKKKDEEERVEAEKTAKFVEELTSCSKEAEEAIAAFSQEAEPFQEDAELSVDQVKSVDEACTAASAMAFEKVKACTDLITKNPVQSNKPNHKDLILKVQEFKKK